MGAGAVGKGIPGVQVNGGDYIPPNTKDDDFDGIESHAVARVQSLEFLRFPDDFLAFDGYHLPIVPDLLREPP